MNFATHHPRRALAIAVAIAIALLALLPGTWGTALAQTAGTVVVTFTVNGTETTVETTTDNLATITIPPGSTITGMEVFTSSSPDMFVAFAAAGKAQVALASFLGVDAGALNANTGSIGAAQSADGTWLVRTVLNLNFTVPTSSLAIEREALVMDAGALLQHGFHTVNFTAPVDLGVVASMTINVPPEALADVGGDLSRIEIIYLNEFTGEAEPVTMLPSPGPGQIAFEWSKEGTYILVTRPLVPLPPLDLAAAGGPSVPTPADTGMGATESGATNTLAIVLGVVALAGILGAGSLAASRRRA
jgi:hypothetical protein